MLNKPLVVFPSCDGEKDYSATTAYHFQEYTMEKKPGIFKIWAAQTRANFLLLSVLLVAIGLSMAVWQMGRFSFNYIDAALLVIGVVLTHISVNLFNEYSDNETGIDFNTTRTPFSGGSGMLQEKLTKPETVFRTAVISLLIALAIGIYFCFTSHWLLIFIILIGGATVISYTTYLTEWLLGEIAAGLGLGTLVVLGVYIAVTTSWSTPISDVLPFSVFLVSVPPGILTFLLLLLNEFPDAEADEKGGRFHIVIFLGKKKAAYLYSAGLLATYLIIVMIFLFNLASVWILISLATLPIAIAAGIITIKYGEDTARLIPAIGMNVLTVLITDSLIAASFLISIYKS